LFRRPPTPTATIVNRLILDGIGLHKNRQWI